MNIEMCDKWPQCSHDEKKRIFNKEIESGSPPCGLHHFIWFCVSVIHCLGEQGQNVWHWKLWRIYNFMLPLPFIAGRHSVGKTEYADMIIFRFSWNQNRSLKKKMLSEIHIGGNTDMMAGPVAHYTNKYFTGAARENINHWSSVGRVSLGEIKSNTTTRLRDKPPLRRSPHLPSPPPLPGTPSRPLPYSSASTHPLPSISYLALPLPGTLWCNG